MWRSETLLLIVSPVLVLGVASCGNPEPKPPYKPPKTAELRYSQTNACECTGAREAFVYNSDGVAHTSSIEITVRESATDNLVTRYQTGPIVTQPGGSSSLGCTVDKAPLCKFKVDYRLVSDTKLKSSTTPVTRAFGELFVPDINTCFAVCNDAKDNTCLRLGAAALPVTMPMTDLYLKAVKAGDGIISSAEVAKAYGDSNADSCKRGDIEISNQKVRNLAAPGYEGCLFTSSKITKMFGATALQGWIPADLQAVQASSVRIAGASSIQEHLRFDDRDHTLNLSFTGPGSQLLNDTYGGNVRTMSVVDDKVYFATENGCMSAPSSK
jgi:hypothetical protein